MLTLIADKNVSIGLVLIAKEFVSVLTLIADKNVSTVHWFGIDCLRVCVCVDIDS